MTGEPALPRHLVLILAPLAGALVTLSLAPFEIWPAGIAGVAVLAYLLCTCPAPQAAWPKIRSRCSAR